MVGNATFPRGSISYQLQGESQNGRTFRYESTQTAEFSSGSYSLVATSVPGELNSGQAVTLLFELYNYNFVFPAHFTFSVITPSRFSAFPQQSHATVVAGSSTQLSVLVTSGSHAPGSTHQITLRATDGCTTVSASQTLTIATPVCPGYMCVSTL